MNSIRMLPGASTNTMRRVPNTPDTTFGTPHHVVALDLAIEVVGEGRDVQEAVGRQRDLVLVDRTGEEGDLQRSERDVDPLAAVPRAPVAHDRAGPLVELDGGVEIG